MANTSQIVARHTTDPRRVHWCTAGRVKAPHVQICRSEAWDGTVLKQLLFVLH
jgi:hypothetical protein